MYKPTRAKHRNPSVVATSGSSNQQPGDNRLVDQGLEPMQALSRYNAGQDFSYNLKESRLRKCVSIIQSLKVGRMLDIGCSRGDWARFWQAQGWKASGVDLNHEHLTIARGAAIDAHFCDLNCDPLPFGDGTFDLIFAGEVIEHLVDTDAFLAEVRRCIKPGGHLLLTTPNLASFENRVRLLLGIYPKWLNYNLSESGHVRGYTAPVLKRQLAVHGFRVLRHTGNWVPFIPQHFTDDAKIPWLAVTGDLLPNLAMDIIVLAAKN